MARSKDKKITDHISISEELMRYREGTRFYEQAASALELIKKEVKAGSKK